MNVTDRVCNLECVKEGTVHEFVGPVKIILVDPPQDVYNRRKSGAAFVAFANMMIGANNFIIILFTLGFKLPLYINAHIILCTIGYQLVMPSAILMLHALNGAAAPLKKSQRRREHIALNLIGVTLSITGSVLAIYYGEPSLLEPSLKKNSSYHYHAGCITAFICGACVITGPLIFLKKLELTSPSYLIYFHRLMGMLAFLSGSICFILGIIKPSMLVWMFITAYVSPVYLVILFAVFYTFVVLVTPASKFIPKSKS